MRLTYFLRPAEKIAVREKVKILGRPKIFGRLIFAGREKVKILGRMDFRPKIFGRFIFTQLAEESMSEVISRGRPGRGFIIFPPVSLFPPNCQNDCTYALFSLNSGLQMDNLIVLAYLSTGESSMLGLHVSILQKIMLFACIS